MTAYQGTGLLLKLALRRDRVMMPSWIYGLTAAAVGAAYSTAKLYDDVAARHEFAQGIGKNPALLALYGHVYDADSVGALSVWKTAGTGAIMVAVMSLLFVVRHTRADEETGRLELVGSGVIGRSAALAAGVLTAFLANVILAVLVAAGLIAVSLPVAGSIAFALSWLAVGMMFAGVAAITAQLTENSRTANGLALAVVGVSYLLRGIGDASGGGLSWLSWVSPFGWTQHIRPYAGERWWLLGVCAAFVVACLWATFALVGRRDVGTGLIAPRLGPAEGSERLAGPLALAWRLQRGSLLAWAAGFAVYGAAMGGVVDSVGSFANGNKATDFITRLGGQSRLVDAFLATVMGIMALIASAYAVQAVLRLRSEETTGRAEPLLATRVRRTQWAAAHLVFAVAGPAVLLAVEGLFAGLIHGARVHDVGGQLPRVVWAALVQLPAVWVLAAIALAIYGLVPRAAAAAWGTLGVFVLIGEIGPIMELKQWALDVSPFTHVPKLPGTEMRVTPLVWLVAIAAALALAGLAGLRRRDIG